MQAERCCRRYFGAAGGSGVRRTGDGTEPDPREVAGEPAPGLGAEDIGIVMVAAFLSYNAMISRVISIVLEAYNTGVC